MDRCEPRNRAVTGALQQWPEIGPSRAEISHELPKHPVTSRFARAPSSATSQDKNWTENGREPVDWLRVLLPGSVRRLMPGIASQLVLFLGVRLQRLLRAANSLLRTLAADPKFIMDTPFVKSTGDEPAVVQASRWWEQLTGAGGEEQVEAARFHRARTGTGLVQPTQVPWARVPEESFTAQSMRRRSGCQNSVRVVFGASLATREFALGTEAFSSLRGAVAGGINECVFAC